MHVFLQDLILPPARYTNPATMATLNLAAAVMDGYVSVVISMPTVAMLVGSLAVFVCLAIFCGRPDAILL